MSPLLAATLLLHPWGKDAGLTTPTPPHIEERCSTPLLGPLAEAAIRFHQVMISPADGPRSHFIPSSSQYTLKAMQKYGLFEGFLMGCDRLMRENSDPWIYEKKILGPHNTMKYDPVP